MHLRSLLFLSFLVVSACQKDEPDPIVPVIAFVKPAHFAEPTYDFVNNPITPERFALGRKLFFDPILSRDGSISCGDCHQQQVGFAHAGHQLSHGVDSQFGTRNSPALANLAWQPAFSWDGGVFDLDLFPVSPIENPVEMGEKLPNVLQKLRAHPDYPGLFAKAWGDNTISTDQFLKSLSQYMLLLVADNSRYDQYLKGDANALTATEKDGLTVFRAKCATCHTEPMLSDFTFRNNGLSPNGDLGRERITLNADDNYKFKVPGLRNIAKSAPYMHDGRLPHLEDVLDHYASGVTDGPTLDLLLKQNGVLGIPLSDLEKAQLLAFLQALTDDTFLKDRRFMQ